MSISPAGFDQVPKPAKQRFLRRKLSRKARIWASVGAIVLGVSFALVIQIFVPSNDPANAKVGDCVRNDGSAADPSVRTLSCSDPGASFKVLWTVNSGNMKDCDSVAGTVAAYTQTVKDDASSNLLLCLGSNPH